MANTIELNELETDNINAFESINMYTDNELPDCRLIRFQAYTQALSEGFSQSDAASISYMMYFDCMAFRAKNLFP